jgi:hypothetical membrane protein
MSVARWALASAITAPVALIGGWRLAAARQPSFDPARQTISALAATTATEPGIMTAGLAVTGVAHVVTAAGLRPVPGPARVLHAVGGTAMLVVALLPNDVHRTAHRVAAGIGFGTLAVWPALAGRRGAAGVLAPAVTVGASVALGGTLGWFVRELQSDSDAVGRSERVLAGAEALWPLVVVVALRRPGCSAR